MRLFRKLVFSLLLVGVLTSSLTSNLKAEEAIEELGPATNALSSADASTYGYLPVDYHIPSISESSGASSKYSRLLTASLPTSYDSRSTGRITPVKDQGTTGCCWAFAAMASSESSQITEGLTSANVDLSEHHLAYFANNIVADPLGGTAGDKITLPTSTDYLNMGGNSYISTFMLANWVGVVNETTVPFPTTNTTTTLNPSLAYNYNTAHLQNAYWVSMKDTAIVKQLITNYGAAVVAYYTDPEQNDYNQTNWSYYYNGSDIPNHEVTVVGWDDTYSRTKFGGYKGALPSNNGAWLIKNSWGSDWGNAGYFWLSYEDTSLLTSDAAAYDFESTTNYLHNYQYDGTGSYTWRIAIGSPTIANVFTASSCEGIDAVSFYTGSPNINYSVQIYTGIASTSSPTNGLSALTTPQTGTASYAGYHTIKLTTPITLNPGEKFSVLVTLTNPSGGSVDLLIDRSYVVTDGPAAGLTYTCSSIAGQSYISSNGLFWTDYSKSSNENFRIKAFTTSRISMADATVSDVPTQAYTGVAITPKITLTKGGTVLNEGSDYTLSYLNNSAAGTGTIVIRGTGAYGGTITKTFPIVQGVVNISSSTTLTVNKIKNQVYSGKTKKPGLTIKNGNYSLTANYDYTLSYKNNKKIGTATVTITGKANFTGTKKVTFKIVPKKVTNVKIKSSKSKTATLSWKKVTGITGYEVAYSTKKSSGYKSAGTTKSISLTKKKLKKNKKYYLKVRAYKTINGKKYYSSYSTPKIIKVK